MLQHLFILCKVNDEKALSTFNKLYQFYSKKSSKKYLNDFNIKISFKVTKISNKT